MTRRPTSSDLLSAELTLGGDSSSWLRRWKPRGLGVAVLAAVVFACSGGGSTPRSSAGPTQAVPIRATAWALPAAAMGTQRLLRLRYDGPEGDVSLRLTLRIETPLRFQLSGADRLGRPHWGLDVSGGEALWIDHDAETHCTGPPDVQLPGWTDGPVRLDALPAILLGALPGGGGGSRGTRRLPDPDGGTRLEFEDASGQRWSASLDGREELRTWTLWQQGRPTWWWRREGAGGRLSQRDGGRQLSWEEILVEPMDEPLDPLAIPEGFVTSCPSVAS